MKHKRKPIAPSIVSFPGDAADTPSTFVTNPPVTSPVNDERVNDVGTSPRYDVVEGCSVYCSWVRIASLITLLVAMTKEDAQVFPCDATCSMHNVGPVGYETNVS